MFEYKTTFAATKRYNKLKECGSLRTELEVWTKDMDIDIIRWESSGGYGSMRWVLSLMRRQRGMIILLSLYDLLSFLLISLLIALLLAE